MATSAGEVEVKLSLNADDFKKALTQGQADLQVFNDVLGRLATTLLATFSFTAIADFFKKSLTAYAENELAVTRLIAALNNQGIASRSLVNDLTSMAEALQNNTGVSKNAIIEAETLLTTFGVQGTVMKQVIQATLDLSAATGVDLMRAAMLMGKAFEGHTSTLSRYGVIVNSHIDTQKRFASVMDQVNFRFGGAAQAQAETYIGKMNIMKLAFNDLQEQVGSFLAGPAGGFVTWLTDTIRLETSSLQNITAASTALGGLGNVIKTALVEVLRDVMNFFMNIWSWELKVVAQMPMIGAAAGRLRTELDNLNKTLNVELNAWQAASQAGVAGESKKQTAVLQTKEIVIQSVEEASTYTKDKMAEEVKLRSKIAADNKQQQLDFALGFVVTQGEMWKFASQMRDTFFQGFGDSLAQTIVEGKDFGASMKQIFQQMAEAIISYIIQMIAKLLVLLALETATGTGPVGGMAVSGFSGLFAEGGVIGEPSIITGLRSGRKILAGEAGPEMVVPMGSGNQTASEMGGMPGMGGGGGGSITINISGQFLEADQNTWNRLVRDQIIPQIRRFSMTSPISPFNRVRGVV